ncbi:elafin [Pteropus alecto]|uniref:Elafin n=1 Tax=Pteropus alecto TaxID=9402 RepID=L5K145_PTEAL|nr:elafin [Pteropus alecto]ELK04228.1 Elafin [Pteropus alecto]
MRSSSFLALAVFLILGMLAAQAAVIGVPYKGQEADKGHVLVKGQGPVGDQYLSKKKFPGGHGPVIIKSKPGSCPVTLIRCAMLNPPDACLNDVQCPGAKKCCVGSCGKACMNPQ